MKKVKWGIISTGRIAGEFASDFKYVSNAELVAVASRSQATADEFARKHDVRKAYDSYEQLYEDPEIEAIYVATPHNFHFENSWAALSHGKAVLCEKPITVNPKQFDELRTHAKTQNQYLMEGMWTYFHPAIQKAQQWVKDGRIGDLVQIKADFGYAVPFNATGRMYSPELAGGALLDMGIYPLAMAWLLLQADPDAIYVTCHKAATGVDDDVNILFDFGNQTANLATSIRSTLSNKLMIVGTAGSIHIPHYWKASECTLFDGDNQIDHFDDGRASIGFNHELQAVSQDIIDGKKESDIMPHSHSAKFQEWMAEVMAKF
ncbi:MAG: Gfo/Idh/MocA family oxidoreductase [Marinoscillum sp.]